MIGSSGFFSLAVAAFFVASSFASDAFPPSKPDPALSKAYRAFFEDEKISHHGETDALLVYRRGALVFERYGHGYSETRKHRSWSMAKSFTTTLFGLIHERLNVPIDTKVSECLPAAVGTSWSNVSLVDLASMASGIRWNENYDWSPLNSHVTAMLYRMPEPLDMGGYRLEQRRVVAPPGARFNYASGDTNLLAACLRKYLPNRDWIAFAREALFTPLGISRFTIELDGEGSPVGSSYLYLTARDYLRFGLLYLGKGEFGGKRLISETWIRDAIAPGSPFRELRLDHDPPGRAYGRGFWLNTPVGSAQIGRAHASLPSDAYYAQGYEGQFILVIPSEETVVVRLGHDAYGEDRFRLEDFRALTLAADAGHPAAESVSPGPAKPKKEKQP